MVFPCIVTIAFALSALLPGALGYGLFTKGPNDTDVIDRRLLTRPPPEFLQAEPENTGNGHHQYYHSYHHGRGYYFKSNQHNIQPHRPFYSRGYGFQHFFNRHYPRNDENRNINPYGHKETKHSSGADFESVPIKVKRPMRSTQETIQNTTSLKLFMETTSGNDATDNNGDSNTTNIVMDENMGGSTAVESLAVEQNVTNTDQPINIWFTTSGTNENATDLPISDTDFTTEAVRNATDGLGFTTQGTQNATEVAQGAESQFTTPEASQNGTDGAHLPNVAGFTTTQGTQNATEGAEAQFTTPEVGQNVTEAEAQFTTPEVGQNVTEAEAQFTTPEVGQNVTEAEAQFTTPEVGQNVTEAEAQFTTPEAAQNATEEAQPPNSAGFTTQGTQNATEAQFTTPEAAHNATDEEDPNAAGFTTQGTQNVTEIAQENGAGFTTTKTTLNETETDFFLTRPPPSVVSVSNTTANNVTGDEIMTTIGVNTEASLHTDIFTYQFTTAATNEQSEETSEPSTTLSHKQIHDLLKLLLELKTKKSHYRR